MPYSNSLNKTLSAYIPRLIWKMFRADVDKNLLIDYVFRENRLSESHTLHERVNGLICTDHIYCRNLHVEMSST
jgi:hypothetical protein